MTVTIPIQAIQLSPGSKFTVKNINWQDFEEILNDLGEDRNTRISYYQGTLEIMSPLARHERFHRIIAYIVTTILETQNRNWEDFGSTTLKQPIQAGVEPDTCFYIENADRVRGCNDLDLSIYPPPDLAIESDITSKTTLDAYLALGVPEVWIYDENHRLTIQILENGQYLESSTSPTFPDLSIRELIPQLVQQAIDRGTPLMLRELKNRLNENILEN
jgi:Uma2 family endonuclease